MAIGDPIAAEAVKWLGTSFHHRASCKGVGADCFGFVKGVYQNAIGQFPIEWPDYAPPISPKAHYGLTPKILAPFFEETPQISNGALLVFRLKYSDFWHLGISIEAARAGYFIHAHSRYGVVEEKLSDRWASRLECIFQMV